MSSLTKDDVLNYLKEVQDPELSRDIVALGMVKEVQVEGRKVLVSIEVTAPTPAVGEKIKASVMERLSKDESIDQVEVNVVSHDKQGSAFMPKMPLPGIKHVVAVASGKGGVGKTTTSVNLALALIKRGFRVGLMDGDIYGPNVPLMLGVKAEDRPQVNPNQKLIPLEPFGLKMISMALLVAPDQPMVWRGPMLHSAVTQFLQQVDWGELDFLLIDLPPGTGDVQLSLVQNVSLSGAVIVTTPQEVALLDVRKGVGMFRKTGVPILGIVENMTGDIFGEGGGQKAAMEFQVPLLAQIPLDPKVREGGDGGQPVVMGDEESVVTKNFLAAADNLIAGLKQEVGM